MRFKKALTGFLSVTVLSVSTATAFAASTENLKTVSDSLQLNEVMPISAELNEEQKSYFGSFTGTVKEITDFKGIEGAKFVSVENEEGTPANFIISSDTYIVDGAEISVGSVITGYYDANAPMIMIYPPQYSAEVVVVENKDQNFKVDIFDENLVSSDNSLKLNISDDTEIILQDGKAFEGELANRKLVVIYDVSTKSIPAQTNPTKIIVLFEKAVSPAPYLTEDEIVALTGDDVSAMDIVVNDEKIEAPAAYINEQGTIMVPLRAIAEALGFEVIWNNQSKSVTLDKEISLRLGEDNYINAETAPIKLGAAPATVEDRTFVPLNFFEEVTRINNVHLSKSQILIVNGETTN